MNVTKSFNFIPNQQKNLFTMFQTCVLNMKKGMNMRILPATTQIKRTKSFNGLIINPKKPPTKAQQDFFSEIIKKAPIAEKLKHLEQRGFDICAEGPKFDTGFEGYCTLCPVPKTENKHIKYTVATEWTAKNIDEAEIFLLDVVNRALKRNSKP